MTPQLNRKTLKVNNRRGLKEQFNYSAGYVEKSVANPTTLSWTNRGKGIQGESVNSQNQGSKFIVNKNWKPL
jgi:hypothetical protein